MAQPHCVVYDGHTPLQTDPDTAAALAQARSVGGMVWVDLSQPTREQVHELAAVFGLAFPASAVEAPSSASPALPATQLRAWEEGSE